MFTRLGWWRAWFSDGLPEAPPRPQLGKSKLKAEERNVLIYEIAIGPVESSSDVVERHLKVYVNGFSEGMVKLERTAVKAGGLRFNAGDFVRLELRDVDEAGNHSEMAVCEFEAADTIAPDAPVGFGVTLVGEFETEGPDLIDSHPLATVESHEKTSGKAGEGKAAIAIETEKDGPIDPESSRTRLASDLKSGVV